MVSESKRYIDEIYHEWVEIVFQPFQKCFPKPLGKRAEEQTIIGGARNENENERTTYKALALQN